MFAKKQTPSSPLFYFLNILKIENFCKFKIAKFIFKLKHIPDFNFSCPCDAGLTYIGKSTRHVITRAKEHLNLGSSVKSKIKDHIIECNLCNKKDMDGLIHRFSIIKKCSSDYDCKIHKALIIKKHQPKLNKQLYENGSSFLLQLF